MNTKQASGSPTSGAEKLLALEKEKNFHLATENIKLKSQLSNVSKNYDLYQEDDELYLGAIRQIKKRMNGLGFPTKRLVVSVEKSGIFNLALDWDMVDSKSVVHICFSEARRAYESQNNNVDYVGFLGESITKVISLVTAEGMIAVQCSCITKKSVDLLVTVTLLARSDEDLVFCSNDDQLTPEELSKVLEKRKLYSGNIWDFYSTSDSRFINELYMRLFKRKPDKEGYSHYMSTLESGTSRDELISSMMNSEEFLINS